MPVGTAPGLWGPWAMGGPRPEESRACVRWGMTGCPTAICTTQFPGPQFPGVARHMMCSLVTSVMLMHCWLAIPVVMPPSHLPTQESRGLRDVRSREGRQFNLHQVNGQ